MGLFPSSAITTVPHGYNLNYKRVFGSFERVTNAFALMVVCISVTHTNTK